MERCLRYFVRAELRWDQGRCRLWDDRLGAESGAVPGGQVLAEPLCDTLLAVLWALE